MCVCARVHKCVLPLEVVWCEIRCVVDAYVVRREATALTNQVSHEVEIHPENNNSNSTLEIL